MTFNIFPVVYFAVSRSLLASGQRLAMVAQRLARLLARDAADALPGAGGGDAAGVYSPSRSLAYRRRWAAGREW
jgi:hypothetical protein